MWKKPQARIPIRKKFVVLMDDKTDLPHEIEQIGAQRQSTLRADAMVAEVLCS